MVNGEPFMERFRGKLRNGYSIIIILTVVEKQTNKKTKKNYGADFSRLNYTILKLLLFFTHIWGHWT